MPIRIKLGAQGTALPHEPGENKEKSAKYPRVSWGHIYRPCAVVGGGLSVQLRLDILRSWKGDIFGINDTAGYLSDNGIQCLLFAIDTTNIPYRIGPLVKGAVLASRVNETQFEQMGKRPIWVFDLAEEDEKGGIPGGPTAVCRTPALLARMGYRGISYFGIDGSFDPKNTHVSGVSKAAYDNMVIIRAGGKEYYTNAGFMMQNEYMVTFLINPDLKKYVNLESDGLIKAMVENSETWEYIAVADDLKKKYDKQGCMVWSERLTGGNEVWRPLEI